jgi:hypothetical protein
MVRKLKTLSLTLVAAFAMSAIAASVAQATFPAQLTAEAGTTSIHAEQVGNQTLHGPVGRCSAPPPQLPGQRRTGQRKCS